MRAILNSVHTRAVSLVAALVTIYFLPPAEHSFYPRCPVFALTHLQCPGCGGTRAIYQLLHLHLAEALRLNPLITLLFPCALVWCGHWYYSKLRHGTAPAIRLPKLAIAGLYLTVVTFAVVRNIIPAS